VKKLSLIIIGAAALIEQGQATTPKADWRVVSCEGTYANFSDAAKKIAKLWYDFHAQEQAIARGEIKASFFRGQTQWFRHHQFAVSLVAELN